MSIRKVVECDECRGVATDWGAKTAPDAREAAHNEGWIRTLYPDRQDLCPRCQESSDG